MPEVVDLKAAGYIKSLFTVSRGLMKDVPTVLCCAHFGIEPVYISISALFVFCRLRPGGKDAKMKRNIEARNRRRIENQGSVSYISTDGKYYCYQYWDEDRKRDVTVSLEVGKDLSEDITIVLKDMDHDQALNDRYAREQRDALFAAKANRCWAEEFIDPWNAVGSNNGNPEAALFPEPEPESDKVAVVHRIITEDCTASQRELFYAHFGAKLQLEEIRQAEALRTGRLPSAQAFSRRKERLLDRIANALGVERIRRHRSSRQS